MTSRILPQTPNSSSTCYSTARGTGSKAFLNSTKQQYSLPAFPPCRALCCSSISDLRLNMLSVVRKYRWLYVCTRVYQCGMFQCFMCQCDGICTSVMLYVPVYLCTLHQCSFWNGLLMLCLIHVAGSHILATSSNLQQHKHWYIQH